MLKFTRAQMRANWQVSSAIAANLTGSHNSGPEIQVLLSNENDWNCDRPVHVHRH